MKTLLALAILLLALVACQVIVPVTPRPEAATPTPAISLQESGPHFLLHTASPVQLNREGWPAYHPVAFGTVLYPTDLLKVETKTAILCVGPELEVKTVSPGEHRVPCPPAEGILNYRGAKFRVRLADTAGTGDIPFILYPRTTLLLENRPTLYWNDTGASSYTVILTQAGQQVWVKGDVTAHTLPYPADQAPLEQGKDYRLVVIDNDSYISSRQSEPAGTGFRLATAQEKNQIEDQLEKIEAEEALTGVDLQFATGVYYASLEPSASSGFSPLGEAWQIFDTLVKTQTAPAIHLWYGDILTGLKLPDDVVEKAYQRALASAEEMNDVESQATARVRLWCLTETEPYLGEAVELYQELADQAEVQRLQQGQDAWAAVCQ